MSELVMKRFEDLVENKSAGFTNPREKFDANKLKELAADIKERGLVYPLQVWEAEYEGKKMFVVVGGERRRLAIGMLIESGDWPKGRGIECRLVKATNLKEAHYEAVSDNLHREDLSSYELAKEVASLKILGDSQKTIAQHLNKSETWISRKLKAYESASPALRSAWKTGKVPDDTVEDIASLPEEEQDDAVEAQIKLREKGTSQAKKAAKKAAKKKAKKLQRASTRELSAVLAITEKAPKDNSYLRGMSDALRLSLGMLEEDDLKGDFKQLKKELEKAAAVEEAEAEAKAEAKATAKAAKKNGKAVEAAA
jgi:ParB/RepB/Spo0J family partition protein